MRALLLSTLALGGLSSLAQAQSVFPDPDKPLVPLSMYCREPGLVALTFDDGPTNNFPTVLSILASHDVKATFFILGSKLVYTTRIAQARARAELTHIAAEAGWSLRGAAG